ncbi:MAG: restriction endonuclease [Candidatus Dechloromonas phosphoritropha]|jgi:restriction system protein|nr:restriction endonuclease [Candidatus Dechloromonas phosphoritropha]MBP8788707.1 restriction endonuclease [Azonexus sp.]MBP9229727.1 restriction endonuclease [Azonexus sp.]
MGSIWTPTNEFAAFFGEQVGLKSGLALTRDELVTHIGGNDPIASAIASVSDDLVRLRAAEVEDAFQRVLFRLGRLDREFVGHGPTLLHIKYHADAEKSSYLLQVLALLGDVHFNGGKHSLNDGFDKEHFFEKVSSNLPSDAIPIAVELIGLIELSERASPWQWHPDRQVAWKDTVDLKGLFSSESLDATHGTFFDQRFIDYLSANFDRIDNINWRKFEGLAAEFFVRSGYTVDVGPGRNDGGVDIRAWNLGATPTEPPLILIQCKRQKEKVGKTVVKALWADVVDENATSGLVVTSSALAPGADTVRRARSYPIEVADRATLKDWLSQLKTPGTGIFLGS